MREGYIQIPSPLEDLSHISCFLRHHDIFLKTLRYLLPGSFGLGGKCSPICSSYIISFERKFSLARKRGAWLLRAGCEHLPTGLESPDFFPNTKTALERQIQPILFQVNNMVTHCKILFSLEPCGFSAWWDSLPTEAVSLCQLRQWALLRVQMCLKYQFFKTKRCGS